MSVKTKRIIAIAAVMVIMFAFAAVTFAEGETPITEMDVGTVMEGAMTTVRSDVFDAITKIAPIAIGIFGVFLVWRLAKKFIKTSTN